MNRKLIYEFSADVWQHASPGGPGGWYFISIPIKLASEIRKIHIQEEEGWGRLKAVSKIGSSEWQTAIWFDTKQNTYLLPLKAEIMRKEQIRNGETVHVSIWI
jgi:hypothetical protein